MPIDPFKDRFENAKKIIQGTASGSASAPISTELISRATPISGTNTSEIDHFRQGVSLKTKELRFASTNPRMGSNLEDNFISVEEFGISKEFKEDEIYQDLSKFNAKDYLQDADGQQIYPAILNNVSLREPNQLNGVIEPLSIRGSISRTSIDFPFEARSVKGSSGMGNTNSFLKTDFVEQKREIKSPLVVEPYLDSPNSFGLTATGSVLLEGVVSDKEKIIHPYDENSYEDFISSSLSGVLAEIAVSMSLGQSGSYRNFGLIDISREKSTTANYDYFSSAKFGTDSIVYGDAQSYALRGYIKFKDAHTGAIPTNLRTGDADRKGNSKLFFNDINTIIFEKNASLDIGRNLQSSSIYLTTERLSQSIQRKHPKTGLTNYPFIGQTNINRITSGTLYATGSVKSGVSDFGILFNTGDERISPFDEGRAFETDKLDPFFTTGSKIEDIGHGFTTALRSKTKLVINLSPVEKTTFGIDNGSNTNNFPTGYFNFKSKKWEGIGHGKAFTTSSNTTEDIRHFEEGYIGFSVSSKHPSFNNFHTRRNYGAPCSNYGFPLHPKFHATSSQVYHASKSICHPFLVEKMIYEFSGSYDDKGRSSEGTDAPLNTFFILNQRDGFSTNQRFTNKLKHPSETNVILSSSLPAKTNLSAGGQTIGVNSSRDIITFSQISSQHSNITSSNEPELSRDLNIKNLPSNYLWSGSFRLSSSIKAPNKTSEIMTFENGDGRIFMMSNDPGGRNNLEFGTGRDFIKSGKGEVLSGSVVSGTITTKTSKEISFNSPYIIFPNDKLIFGWQTPFDFKPYENEDYPQLTLFPGKGRIILYGSLVRDEKEFHDGLNQNLTSEAISEDIFDDAIGLDQFDTEPYQFLSGTYIDNHITGTLNLNSEKNRQVLGTNFGRGGSLSGSFFRNAQASSFNERFYDTLLPDPEKITKINGAKIAGNKPLKYNSITIGHLNEDENDSSLYDTDWIKGFPFEARYSTARRLTNPFGGIEGEVDFDGNNLNGKLITKKFILSQSLPNGKVVPIFGEDTDSSNISSKTFTPNEDAIKHYYGFGDNASGSVDYKSTGADFGAGSIVRGWKYGLLNGLPQFPKAVFRRDRYGQFRDMLEQRKDGKFFDPESKNGTDSAIIESPIQIQFIADKPSQTLSSNLSTEATSSVPFREGEVSNREDPLNSDIDTAIFTMPT